MEELNVNEIVKIEQMPIVFEQLEKIGAFIEESIKDIDKLECTEKNKQDIKKRRTVINNTLKILEDRRKEIKTTLLKPYEVFNAKYEAECKGKLESASDILGSKINEIEKFQKMKLEAEAREYFEEYKLSKNIEFVKYEDLNLKIGVSDNPTKLKKQVVEFVDKIEKDLKIIETQEYKNEILVEYKKNLDISISITDVVNRHKELELIKAHEEEMKEIQDCKDAVVEEVNTILTAPKKVEINEQDEKEKIFAVNFKVTATRNKLKELVEFLKEGEFNYEQY